MAEAEGGTERYNPPGPTGWKNKPNLSGGWVVMLLSGLIAAVVFLFVTQQGGQRFTVAVAAKSIAPGEKVTPDSFRQAQVNLPRAQLDRMVQGDEIDDFDGFVAISPLEPGDPVVKSSLRATAGQTRSLRAMSIPVPRERAVEGGISPGDRVDIVGRFQSASYIVATDLEVLRVTSGSGNAIGGGSEFTVTVAVTAEESVAINFAINENRHDVVRSTGASPIANPSATRNSGQSAGAAGAGAAAGGATP